MWPETPSSTRPIRTGTPNFGTSSWKTFVQFGAAKIASETSRPTFRASTSKAATTSRSLGRKPPISQCISPIASAGSRPA
jgi:hypothetical protein